MNERAEDVTSPEPVAPPTMKPRWRVTMWILRLHLYTGLALLPWVFLYGITGAMFNHQGLFPEATIIPVSPEQLAESSLSSFPAPEALAREVASKLETANPGTTVTPMEGRSAEFNNNVILEVRAGGKKHAVQIDPVSHGARVVVLPENSEQPEPLLDTKHVTLEENPYQLAREAVPQIMAEAGIDSHYEVSPRGWCKLNFLAEVNGDPARITYVLRDGHVDVTRFTGEDGMTLRHFFLRLHTSHGQPPHWNARMIWSLIVDTMAIAMVFWGVSGLIMWWQVKRTRLLGAMILAMSVLAACWLYVSMIGFYATTKL